MERISYEPSVMQAATPKYSNSNWRLTRRASEDNLAVPTSDELELLVRSFDDYPESKSLNGYGPDLISPLGYKVCISGCASPVKIPRRQIVIPIKNCFGRVIALCDPTGRWFTKRQIHLANSIRAAWTREIEVFNNPVTADVESVQRNIAAAALNGFSWQDLEYEVAHRKVKLLWGEELEVAA